MKAPTGKLAFAYRTIAALEDERNTLRAEVEQLRKDAERYRGVRRVAAAQGYTEERFDEQTDRKIARFDAAMRNEQ